MNSSACDATSITTPNWPSTSTAPPNWWLRDSRSGATKSSAASAARASWDGCGDAREVVLYTVIGGGHSWPGADPTRGQGLTTRLLDAAMAYAVEHGAPAVEAYPVDPGDGRIPAALGYTGVLSTFEAAGFKVVQEIVSPQATVRRVIVRREL